MYKVMGIIVFLLSNEDSYVSNEDRSLVTTYRITSMFMVRYDGIYLYGIIVFLRGEDSRYTS